MISIDHTFSQVGDIGIYRLPLFSSQKGIDHGFSARTGGVSSGDFASLNLSFTRPEDRSKVIKNYQLFCKAANIPLSSMVMDNYEHGTTVLRVNREHCLCGYTREPLPPCDGIITNDPMVTLMTGHADCMSFYCYDPVTRSIGLAHAGWRGAKGRIGTNLVNLMAKEFNCNPKDILVGLGPSICPKCFEVGEDVAQAFEREFPSLPIRGTNARGNPTIDLWQVAQAQFAQAGILNSNIQIMGVCTVENNHLLFSHRGDHGRTGGATAFLRLTEQC